MNNSMPVGSLIKFKDGDRIRIGYITGIEESGYSVCTSPGTYCSVTDSDIVTADT